MIHDPAILVHVHGFAEVEDVVGPLADREIVPGHLNELAALGFALLDNPRLHAVDLLGLVQDGDGQPDVAALELERVAWFQDEIGIATGGDQFVGLRREDRGPRAGPRSGPETRSKREDSDPSGSDDREPQKSAHEDTPLFVSFDSDQTQRPLLTVPVRGA